MERIDHPIPPLYDGSSRILILGSFPSVKSREAMFFYGHPQNRFWPVLAAVLGCERPTTIEEKKRLALTHHIALWDTIASCEIEGSSDSSIRGVVPNDLTPILRGADIRQIYCNGGTSYQYFRHAFSAPACRRHVRCSSREHSDPLLLSLRSSLQRQIYRKHLSQHRIRRSSPCRS